MKKPTAQQETKVGGFTITLWDHLAVYIADKDGRGVTFPAREIKRVLGGKSPASDLQNYWDENF